MRPSRSSTSNRQPNAGDAQPIMKDLGNARGTLDAYNSAVPGVDSDGLGDGCIRSPHCYGWLEVEGVSGLVADVPRLYFNCFYMARMCYFGPMCPACFACLPREERERVDRVDRRRRR